MMRARRIAILLALTAVSALTLFILVLVDGDALGTELTAATCVGTMPDTLASYAENVLIGPDGDVLVEVSVVLAEGGPGGLLLPFAFVDGHDFTVLSGPVRFAVDETGTPQPVTRVLGHRMLNLVREAGAGAGDQVFVQAQVPGWFRAAEVKQPYGEFSIRREFVNSSAFFLRDFRMGVRLPRGMRVHAIRKVIPGYNPKKSPQPPYEVGQIDDHGTATLHVQDLGPADAVLLDILVRPARRGPLPLIVGLVFAVLYLVFFRDVLKPRGGK